MSRRKTTATTKTETAEAPSERKPTVGELVSADLAGSARDAIRGALDAMTGPAKAAAKQLGTEWSGWTTGHISGIERKLAALLLDDISRNMRVSRPDGPTTSELREPAKLMDPGNPRPYYFDGKGKPHR